jgi:hypothetical protein
VIQEYINCNTQSSKRRWNKTVIQSLLSGTGVSVQKVIHVLLSDARVSVQKVIHVLLSDAVVCKI